MKNRGGHLRWAGRGCQFARGLAHPRAHRGSKESPNPGDVVRPAAWWSSSCREVVAVPGRRVEQLLVVLRLGREVDALHVLRLAVVAEISSSGWPCPSR